MDKAKRRGDECEIDSMDMYIRVVAVRSTGPSHKVLQLTYARTSQWWSSQSPSTNANTPSAPLFFLLLVVKNSDSPHRHVLRTTINKGERRWWWRLESFHRQDRVQR